MEPQSPTKNSPPIQHRKQIKSIKSDRKSTVRTENKWNHKSPTENSPPLKHRKQIKSIKSDRKPTVRTENKWNRKSPTEKFPYCSLAITTDHLAPKRSVNNFAQVGGLRTVVRLLYMPQRFRFSRVWRSASSNPIFGNRGVMRFNLQKRER